MDVAIKNADLVNSIFGEGGTKKATSGHQEIELALLKLAAACQEAQADDAQGTYKGLYGEKSDCYVKLAKRFLDLRGDTTDRDGYYSFGANNAKYRQDHEKVSKQTEAVGHVVRAMYQYIAMTDVTLLSDTYVYDNALTSLWKDVTGSKMYVTGGMGVVNNDESFGSSYQLPVNGAYSETCGSIGSVMWNQRMNMLYGDKKYIDVMETTLYNAVISGVNFDGNKFFYQNPISSDGSVERSAWFGCACCPPNLMRLINSLGGYLYTQDENVSDFTRLNQLISDVYFVWHNYSDRHYASYLVTILLMEIVNQNALCGQPERKKSKEENVYGSVCKKIEAYLRWNCYITTRMCDIAEYLGYSEKYISVVFKKGAGKTVREYLSEQIVERAKESLLNSEYSITQIAYSFGFSDAQNFTRTFKKISGLTPTQFRNQFLVVYEDGE